MKKIILLVIVCIYLYSCSSTSGNTSIPDSPTTADNGGIRIKTFRVNDGYGYEIYVDGKKVIRQPHIPTLEKDIQFPDEELALEVATLVSSRVKDGISPEVTTTEVDAILFRETSAD